MQSYIFLLSGDCPDLAFSELRCVINSLFGGRKIERLHERLASTSLEERGAKKVSSRLSYTKLIGQLICLCEVKDASDVLTRSYIPVNPSESFAFRAIKLDKSVSIPSPVIERMLGGVIAAKGFRVSLKKPDRLIIGIIYKGRIAVAVLVSEPSKEAIFEAREPSKRPFFHPSSMRPRLARCIVNLSCCGPGSIIIDPFCGVGGIMIEAGILGYRTVGIDLDWDMLMGAKENLRYYRVYDYDLICGDASKPPLRSGFGCVITDPPYGRGASTYGKRHSDLIIQMLESIMPMQAVIVTYMGSRLEESVGRLGFEVAETHRIKVHRSLTRIILRLVRKHVDKVSGDIRHSSNR